MDFADSALIIDNIFDSQSLIASRTWEILHEGVFISPIYQSDDNSPRAAFLHYLPGSSIPTHLHAGFEHILILEGSQQDGDRLYSSGTLVIHRPGSHHWITSASGCLALGIWERPVRFN